MTRYDDPATITKPLLSNQTYDILKWIAQYFLPALGTLYYTISLLWGLPYTEQVVGTIVAVDMFLGALLGISMSSFKKSVASSFGDIVLDNSNPEKDVVRLVLKENPETLQTLDQVVFKVVKT